MPRFERKAVLAIMLENLVVVAIAKGPAKTHSEHPYINGLCNLVIGLNCLFDSCDNTLFLNKNIIFAPQAEYSHFFAEF